MNRWFSKQYPWGCGAVVLVALALMAPAEVEADEPDLQFSDYVDDSSITVEPNYTMGEGNFTAFVGIEECESLVGDEEDEQAADVDVSYETGVPIEEDDRFGGLFYYQRERGEEGQISCRDDEDDTLHDDCTEIDDEEITFDGGEPASDVSATIPFDELTGLAAADCEAGEVDESYYVQLRLRDRDVDGNPMDWQRSELRVIVDLIRPDAPALTDAISTENSIRVEFDPSESEDVDGHFVVYSSESFEAGQEYDEVTDSPLFVDGEEPVEGDVDADLEPGSTVYVGMVSRDRTGNFSFTSDSMETTVIETDGFWDFYVDQGGSEEGGYGCGVVASTTTPAGTLFWGVIFLMLAFVGRWLTGRRTQAEKRGVRVRKTEVGRR